MTVDELRDGVCAGGRSYAETTRNGRTDACCADNEKEAQEYLKPVETIASTRDLPPGVTLIRTSAMNLKRDVEYPFGFALHAPREIAQSVLRGTTGLCVDAAGTARAGIEATGRFEARAWREGERLRLRISSARARGLEASAAVEAIVTVKTPSPKGDDDLLAALLGSHPLQWLRQSLLEIGSMRWKRLAGFSSEGIEVLERLTRLWSEISAKEESALWKAIGTVEWARLARCVDYILAGRRTAGELVSVLKEALEENPAIGESPVMEWLETVSGERIEESLGDAALKRVQAAAARIVPLVSDEVFVGLLNRLKEQAMRETDVARPDRWVQKQISDAVEAAAGGHIVEKWKSVWRQVRGQAYEHAAGLLGDEIAASVSAELQRSARESAAIDCSFEFTDEGLAAFRRTLEGDLDAAISNRSVRLHHALLTHEIGRRKRVELRLPFADRRAWGSELSSIACGEVKADGPARLQGYRLDASERDWSSGERMSALVLSGAFTLRDGEPVDDTFSLAYSMEQEVKERSDLDSWNRALRAYGIKPEWPGRPFRAELLVSAPGSAITAWATSPSMKDPQYHAVFSHVSARVQAFLRRWLPAIYFSEKLRYECLEAAYPLLAYECSTPFEGRRRGSFTYDVMNGDSVECALRSAAARLPARLREARAAFAGGTDAGLAKFYDPAECRTIIHAVRKQRRNFESLLIADAMFVDEIIHLAGAARDIRTMARNSPTRAVKQMARDSARFARAFHGRLNRLYAGRELMSLGPLLFVEATAALSQSGAPVEVSAELRVHSEGGVRAWRNRLAP